MKSYAVIGLGRFGKHIAEQLYSMGKDVLAIDIKNESVQQIADKVTRAAMADARDKEVLRALGIRNVDCAIVAIGENLSASVIITMNLKELEVPCVVCKANDGMHRRVLTKLGADKIIIPEYDGADRLARLLAEQNLLEYIELSEEYGIIEEETPHGWAGKSIRDLNVGNKYGVNILAIKNDGKMHLVPNADYVLRDKDVLVILGEYNALKKIKKG